MPTRRDLSRSSTSLSSRRWRSWRLLLVPMLGLAVVTQLAVAASATDAGTTSSARRRLQAASRQMPSMSWTATGGATATRRSSSSPVHCAPTRSRSSTDRATAFTTTAGTSATTSRVSSSSPRPELGQHHDLPDAGAGGPAQGPRRPRAASPTMASYRSLPGSGCRSATRSRTRRTRALQTATATSEPTPTRPTPGPPSWSFSSTRRGSRPLWTARAAARPSGARRSPSTASSAPSASPPAMPTARSRSTSPTCRQMASRLDRRARSSRT